MNAYDEPRGWSRSRAAAILDKAESFYLRVLRAVILVIATLLLVYAAWLAASSAYKISKSPESVVEEEAVVAPDELTDAQMPTTQTSPSKTANGPRVNPSQNAFYSSFVDRYYSLYRSAFEPYRQREDKQLSKAEFDGAYVNTAARQEAIRKGELNFDNDRKDLETLLTVMTEAAAKPDTIQRLKRYQAARKVPVKERVQRSRTTMQQGWDSTSTACENWYETPMGCPAQRAVEVPYTETITTMQYPEGTQSHTQIFRAFQDRFFELLEQRRNANASKAEADRQSILSGIAEGQLSLMTALQILGAFLVLMFFFLLIAIERHQRKLAGERLLSTTEEVAA
ncbi:hypothetical protein H9L13_05020 [Sphingomonas lutea]|uniref:Uncharacterized protein n=1 Tax=Sphingomonas lutea TaxID=1045317 RepID=A0A7G9SK64_9SPHN|nr:hypothetical protein [Sphingomonas lutea]QNN68239.1 hypothetical protein H9L13_05020 [Sphingomonas lutea]